MWGNKPETVSCETCKHVILKRDAQEIEHKGYSFSYYSYRHSVRYYCPEHSVKYTRSQIDYSKIHYYKEMEVSEDGTPVGYVKRGVKDPALVGSTMGSGTPYIIYDTPPNKSQDKKALTPSQKWYIKNRVSKKPYRPYK